jgi:hypothetical protein
MGNINGTKFWSENLNEKDHYKTWVQMGEYQNFLSERGWKTGLDSSGSG